MRRPIIFLIAAGLIVLPVQVLAKDEPSHNYFTASDGVKIHYMTKGKGSIPVIAIDGEFDRPIAKTHRMWRELRNFTNVVLPGKSHLTAIAAPYMPKEYLESVVRFINANDPKR